MPEVDSHGLLRDALLYHGQKRSDWAGVPMPLDGERLIVEPRFPGAEHFSKMGKPPDDDSEERFLRLRNRFWSWRWKCDIVIFEDTRTGKVDWGKIHGVNHFTFDMTTLGCSDAWGLEQEETALHTLAELASPRQMRHYLLTGMFLETSKRSGLTYVFRRLRPTVALSGKTGAMKILACLCLHPIAFYENSFAGAMTPTDDVIAHLMLMRGDEPMLWRRANQHPAWRSEAGL